MVETGNAGLLPRDGRPAFPKEGSGSLLDDLSHRLLSEQLISPYHHRHCQDLGVTKQLRILYLSCSRLEFSRLPRTADSIPRVTVSRLKAETILVVQVAIG